VTNGLVFVDTTSGEPAWTHAGIWSDGSAGFNGSLVFGTDGDGLNNANIQERMRITSTGNVGIGAPGLNTKLEVAGQTFLNGSGNSIELTLNCSGANYAHFYRDTSGSSVIGLGGSSGISTYPSSPTMAWDVGTGNVGIGTNNPTVALDISRSTGASSDVASIRLSTVAGDNLGPNLRLQHKGGGGRNYGIWSTGANNVGGAGLLQFFDETAGASRMAIDSSGNLGIGTTAPAASLHIYKPYASGTDAFRISFNDSQDYYMGIQSYVASGGSVGYKFRIVNGSGTPVERMAITATGIGIGVTNPAYALEVNGTAHRDDNSASWTTTSDRRLKTEITTLPNGLELVDKVRPVNFRYDESYRAANPSLAASTQYGVIAQEYQQVFPSFVSTNKEGYLAIDPSPLTFVNTAAIQDLHRKLEETRGELTRKVKAQEEELTELRAEVAKLRSERKSLAQSVSALEAGFARLEKVVSKRTGVIEARVTLEDVDGGGK
jgi:hypothetical protein